MVLSDNADIERTLEIAGMVLYRPDAISTIDFQEAMII